MINSGDVCSPLSGTMSLLTTVEKVQPVYHGLVAETFVDLNLFFGFPLSKVLPRFNTSKQQIVSTSIQRPINKCKPFFNTFYPQFTSALLLDCWVNGEEIKGDLRVYYNPGCRGKYKPLRSTTLGSVNPQWDYLTKTSFYQACV